MPRLIPPHEGIVGKVISQGVTEIRVTITSSMGRSNRDSRSTKALYGPKLDVSRNKHSLMVISLPRRSHCMLGNATLTHTIATRTGGRDARMLHSETKHRRNAQSDIHAPDPHLASIHPRTSGELLPGIVAQCKPSVDESGVHLDVGSKQRTVSIRFQRRSGNLRQLKSFDLSGGNRPWYGS